MNVVSGLYERPRHTEEATSPLSSGSNGNYFHIMTKYNKAALRLKDFLDLKLNIQAVRLIEDKDYTSPKDEEEQGDIVNP